MGTLCGECSFPFLSVAEHKEGKYGSMLSFLGLSEVYEGRQSAGVDDKGLSVYVRKVLIKSKIQK